MLDLSEVRLRRARLAVQPIGFVRGRPVFPIMGAEDPVDPPVVEVPPVTDPPADPEFPANTPVADMTPDQRAAYWQDKARKHENTWKSVVDKNLTPEQVLQMQERLNAADRARLTDQERALEDAKAAGRTEAEQVVARQYQERLVAAEFRAALAGTRTAEQITALVDPLDHTKFLTPTGDVDTVKVSNYVAGISPANKQWPDMGQGNRGPQGAPKGVSAGRDLYASTHKK